MWKEARGKSKCDTSGPAAAARVHASFCALLSPLGNVNMKTQVACGNLRRAGVSVNGFSLQKGSIRG
jgi:hypothetical protein